MFFLGINWCTDRTMFLVKQQLGTVSDFFPEKSISCFRLFKGNPIKNDYFWSDRQTNSMARLVLQVQ